MADAEVVLTPGEAARRLKVSPSGLRRLATVYGEVFGELQKDAGGTSRVWPREAVMRLQAARALMAAGQARSVRDALVAVEGGASPRVEVATAGGDVLGALGVVASRLEAVLASNERLEAEVRALRSELAEVRALPASERAGEVEAGHWGGESTGEGDGEAEGSSDGPMVRAVRWLERRLRGGRR